MAKDEAAGSITAWAPASLSNLGPGFDSLGVAITGMGDRVRVRRTRETTTVAVTGDHGRLPTDPRLNTASLAALKVLELAEASGGVEISIEKGIPFGSGLGGSAASAAAGALATDALLGGALDERGIARAVLAGESVASGGMHGDNAIPALVGGVVLVDAADPECYRMLQPGADLRFAIVVPEIQVETSLARRMLPSDVPLASAVRNASSLAWLVEAIAAGDVDLIGRMIMRDTIVEPVRAALIPCYESVRTAALEAGASGCALSGSGPAIFAICRSEDEASSVLAGMVEACSKSGFECKSLSAAVDEIGARIE